MKTALSCLRRVAAAAFCLLTCWSASAQVNVSSNAIAFDGTTNAWISVPGATWFNGPFTIEGWVYVRSYANWSRLVDFSDGINTNTVYLALSQGTTGHPAVGVFGNDVSTGLQATNSIATNQWTHLAAVYDGTNFSIYTNGALIGFGPATFPPPSATRTNCYIGRSSFAVNGDAYANAIFDDVRIWNTARSQLQIQTNMNHPLVGNEAGLAGYWRFDEGTGTTTADATGHSAAATLHSGTTWTPSGALLVPQADYALKIVNTGCQAVTIPYQSSFNTYPLTVMCWFMEPTNVSGGALVNRYVSASLNGWQLAINGHLYGWYYSTSAHFVPQVAGPVVDDNVWHHAAFVVDSTGGSLYLDGVFQQEVAWSGTPAACTTTSPIYLGIYQGDSCISANIDKVSVWNTALSSNQIVSYMNQAPVGTESGLLAYYKIDEGIGSNIFDYTGHNNTGILTGPTWEPFGILNLPPAVATLPASSLTANSATLNGTVNPEGVSTASWFQWGPATNYGSVTPTTSAGGGAVSVNTSAILTGLSLGTNHFRLAATNEFGTVYGVDQVFVLSNSIPSITNLSASGLTSSGAALSAMVDPNGLMTAVSVAYGADTNYGSTNVIGNIGNGSSFVAVSNVLAGLLQSTTYHFQFIASNSAGVTVSADAAFTTASVFVSANNGIVSGYDYNEPGVFADYNNDDSLDMILAQNLYRNNGSGTFTGSNLVSFTYTGAAVAWGDYDNDGNLDLLIAGSDEQNNSLILQLWHNNGNGSFTQASGTGLPAVESPLLAWADFDNDGRQDVFLCGYVSYNYGGNNLAGGVYHNNGNGAFTQVPIPGFGPLESGAVAVADFDNDGWADFIMTGYNPTYAGCTQIWRNDGTGNFALVNVPGLPQLGNSCVAVGDFNNDGRLDFIICGENNSGQFISQVWTNAGNWNFTQDTAVSLTGVVGGAVACGDYDNDGKMDIALTGATALNQGELVNPISQVWRNNGNGGFANIGGNLPGYMYSSVQWGDANNDGRLDLLLQGYPGGNIAVSLEQNQTPATNTPPAAPGGLNASVNGTVAVLNWSAATDAQTPSAGLSYNFRVGTSPGACNIVSPASDTTNGYRRLPQFGNAQENRSAVLTQLPAGTYYWSVQAVDTSYAGSPWAPEQTFTLSGSAPAAVAVTEPASMVTFGAATLNGAVNPENQFATAWFQWGTNTNYGNITASFNAGSSATNVAVSNILTGLTASTTYHFRCVVSSAAETNYGGDLSFATGAPAAPLVTGTFATNITGSSADAVAAVDPNGAAASVWAAYGTDTNYGNITAAQSIGNGTLPILTSNLISGLSPVTAYHFMVFASNSAGVSASGDIVFETTPAVPAATAQPVSNITSTTAELNAFITAGGSAADVYFIYGPTTNYGATNFIPGFDSGTSPLLASSSLAGLFSAVVYHYQIVASNSFGETSTGDLTFETLSGPPVVAQLAATNVVLNAAALAGLVSPGGAATTVYFAYGEDTTYGSTNLIGNIGSGNEPVALTDNISNLSVNTTYHFTIVASNSYGVVSGGDATFTTLNAFTVQNLVNPSYYQGAGDVGDYNNDGNLDLIFATFLCDNTGGGTFSVGNFPTTLIFQGSELWGDFDNDGYLDLLIMGGDAGNESPYLGLWHNNGDGTFTAVNNSGLPSFSEGQAVLGDFNNDGKLDVLLCGQLPSGQRIGGIWTNGGNGTFAQMPIGFTGGAGALVAADFNNDGYLDFLFDGLNNQGYPSAQMWANNGDGTFTQQAMPGFPQVYSSSLSVGDYNNDGLSDVLVSGWNGSYYCQVWSNGGNFNFTQDTQVSLPGLYYGTAVWGDYDNDGNPDIFLAGATSENGGLAFNPVAELWRNTGSGAFFNINAALPALSYTYAAWGDFQNDGKLDLIYEGQPNYYSSTMYLLANNNPVTNTPPTAPTGLAAAVAGNGVVLTWNAATDAQTPSAGLNYNIRVGTTSGGVNIVAPNSDVATGHRRLAQMGNTGEALKAVLTNLSGGTYYWSVQSIDTSFAGSPFAAEGQFSLGPSAVTGGTGQITSGSAVLNGAVNPGGVDTAAYFQVGTTTNYVNNTASMLVGGTNGGPVEVTLLATNLAPLTQYYYRMVASNSSGASYGAASNFTTIATVAPNITGISNAAGNSFQLNFAGESGLGYTLQESTNLPNWFAVTNLTANPAGLFQYTGSNATASPALYFRLSRP